MGIRKLLTSLRPSRHPANRRLHWTAPGCNKFLPPRRSGQGPSLLHQQPCHAAEDFRVDDAISACSRVSGNRKPKQWMLLMKIQSSGPNPLQTFGAETPEGAGGVKGEQSREQAATQPGNNADSAPASSSWKAPRPVKYRSPAKITSCRRRQRIGVTRNPRSPRKACRR